MAIPNRVSAVISQEDLEATLAAFTTARDVAENPLQNYLTTKVTKKWR